MDDQSNILKDLSKETLQATLRSRFDICTCRQCQELMLEHMLTQLPSQGVPDMTLDEGRSTYGSAIRRACTVAVETVSASPPHRLEEDKRHSFSLLLKKILKERSVDLRHYHVELLKRRIALRVLGSGVDSYLEYMKYLDRNPREYDKLFATLCINVSEFFRDPPVWITMRYLMETLIRSRMQGLKEEPHLRLWSAGCANGEEPLSLAIVFREIARATSLRAYVRIFATDIDKECLAFCEKAEYPRSSLGNVEAATVERYFLSCEDIYRARSEIRSLVKYAYLDLTSEDMMQGVDLVCCRNVFIYFNHTLQQKIIEKFHKALLPGGFLILGKSELLPLGCEPLFEEVDGNARIYRRK